MSTCSFVAVMLRDARISMHASMSSLWPRVGPYCSTDGSLPVSSSAAISLKSSQAYTAGSGYPGANEIMSGTRTAITPILRMADPCDFKAALERNRS